MPTPPGRGHLTVRGKADVEETKRGKAQIVITEIPYMVIKTNIVSKIAECVHDNQLPEVADVRDESDRQGLRIVVELKKDADAEIVLNKLYRYTPLQTHLCHCQHRPGQQPARDPQHPGAAPVFHRPPQGRHPPAHAGSCSSGPSNRAHILEGLILAVSDIDEIIEHHQEVARCADGQGRT